MSAFPKEPCEKPLTRFSYGNALTAAAYDGTLDIVKLLLDRGAEIDSPNGWALQAAAAEGHYDVVKELLDRGADVNALATNENFPQGTALQVACESGKVEIVTLLLEHGASPDLGAGEDTCPLIAAATKGEQAILELLVNAKAEVNVFGGWDNSTVLINAVINLPVESLQVLLNAGADVNMTDQEGDTALIVAARAGDADSVNFLLDNGADIFHANQDDENALQSAIKYGDDDDCTEALVDRVSKIMAALNKAMQEGNAAVSNVIRSVGPRNQGLSYDDEEEEPSQGQTYKQSNASDTKDNEEDEEDDEDNEDGKGGEEDTPRTESFPNSARRFEDAAQETAHSSFQPVRQLSDELEAALSSQVALLQKYESPPPRPEKVPAKEPVELPPTTIAELPSQRRYSQLVQAEEAPYRYEFDQQLSQDDWSKRPSFVKQPTMQWATEAESIATDPAPTPGQGPIRRKPAPNMSFGASYAQNPSPVPSALSSSQYQPPAPNPDSRTSLDQRPPYQNSSSYPGAPAYQGLGHPTGAQTQSQLSSQPVHSRISMEYSPPPPPPGPYHAPYDPSSYGRPSPRTTPPQQTQPFPDLPYQPVSAWQSTPPLTGGQQQQQQQSYFIPGNESPPLQQQLQQQQQQEWINQDTR